MKNHRIIAIALLISGVSLSAFAQALSLEDALTAAAATLESKLIDKTKTAVIGATSPSPALSSFISSELTERLVNSGKLIVIERQDLGAVNDELAMSISGDVDDESAQSIGKLLGAEVIVTAALDESYRLRVKAVSVETAMIVAVYSQDVARGGRLDMLLSKGKATAPEGYDASRKLDPMGREVSGFGDPDAWFAFADDAGAADTVVELYTEWETIQGAFYLVVNLETVIPSKFNFAYAGVSAIPDHKALSDLQAAHGIRFKIIGDGHDYVFRVETSDVTDGNWFEKVIRTNKGQIVEISIPYRQLRQPIGKSGKFKKNLITGLSFVTKRSTASPVKIFDVRAY